MSAVRRNFLANSAATAWFPLVALGSAPFYVRLLGLEAFGLLGLFSTIQALATPLDAGLSMTLGRELARLSAHPGSAQEMRDLLKTTEWVYWIVAAALGLLLAMLAYPIAAYWVRPVDLSVPSMTGAIALMGLTLAMQWPFALYQGGVLGLQHQVSMAGINIVMYTVRYAGAAVFLWLVWRSIEGFFVYQAITAGVHTAVTAVWLRRKLPPADKPGRFRKSALHSVRFFAAGIAGVSVLDLLLTQADKVFLSKILPLDIFGLYTAAAMLAAGLLRVFAPFFTTMLPRLTQLIARSQWPEASRLYHSGCRLASVLGIPAAAVLVLFSREVLEIGGAWAGKPQLHEMTGVLSLLTIGMLLNGLMMIPRALQWAYGWTKLSLVGSGAALGLFVPLMITMGLAMGPEGVAAAWIVPNALLLVTIIPLMHRRILAGQLQVWCLRDVLAPALAAAGVAVAAGIMLPPADTIPTKLLTLLGVWVAALLAAAGAAGFLRPQKRRAPGSQQGRAS